MAYNPTFLSNSVILKQLALGGALDPSALIAMLSTTQGFLPPSMTTAQINAIVSPTEGLQAYNNETHQPSYYNGTVWQGIGTSAVLPTAPSAIAIFNNASGGLESSGARIDSGGDLYWATDNVSNLGITGFASFSPDVSPLAFALDNSQNVYVGGAFTTVGYIQTLSDIAVLNTSGDVLTASSNLWISSAVPIASLINDTSRNRTYIVFQNNSTEFEYTFANGGFNQTNGIAVFDQSTKATIASWNTSLPNFGLGGGSFPTAVPNGAQWVDSANDVWYLWNPSGGYNDAATGNLIRLNSSTGDLDTGYNAANTNFDGPVNGMFLDPTSGLLIVVGNFTHYGATAVGGICRLAADGTLDTTFNTGGAGFVGNANCILITPTRTYVGGSFTSYNGTSVNGLVGITTATGAIDNTFPNGVMNGANPGTVNCFSFDQSAGSNIGFSGGALWVGGQFDTFNSITTYGNILYVDETGTDVYPLLGGTAPVKVNGPVTALNVASSNITANVYIGGTFTQFTDFNGTSTAVTNFVQTNEFDGIYHPFGIFGQRARPNGIYAAQLLQVGPLSSFTSYVNIENNVDSGLRGVVNTQADGDRSYLGTSPAWFAQKAHGTIDVPTITAGDNDELTLFLARAWDGDSYTDSAFFRIATDQGSGTSDPGGSKFEWSTKALDQSLPSKVMTLDAQGNLRIGAPIGDIDPNRSSNLLWEQDGGPGFSDTGEIGNINPFASLNMQGVYMIAKTGGDASTNIQVIFLNDGTSGATVTTTGTFPPVSATVTVTVHMTSGSTTVGQVVNALNNNVPVSVNLLTAYVSTYSDATVNAQGATSFVAGNKGRPRAVHVKTEMSIGGETYHVRQINAVTTNNTPTDIFDYDIASNQMQMIEMKAVARRTGGSAGTVGDCASFNIRAQIKNIGGTPTIVQFSNDSFADNANLNVDIVNTGTGVAPNSQKFAVTVTGDTNNTYSWSVTFITQQV